MQTKLYDHPHWYRKIIWYLISLCDEIISIYTYQKYLSEHLDNRKDSRLLIKKKKKPTKLSLFVLGLILCATKKEITKKQQERWYNDAICSHVLVTLSFLPSPTTEIIVSSILFYFFSFSIFVLLCFTFLSLFLFVWFYT